jgi:hypothetical protein
MSERSKPQRHDASVRSAPGVPTVCTSTGTAQARSGQVYYSAEVSETRTQSRSDRVSHRDSHGGTWGASAPLFAPFRGKAPQQKTIIMIMPVIDSLLIPGRDAWSFMVARCLPLRRVLQRETRGTSSESAEPDSDSAPGQDS